MKTFARKSLARTALLTMSATAVLGLAAPAGVSAHPLGNFTINVYNGLTVAPDWVHLDRVVDMAELPSVGARRDIDADRDGVASDAEAAAWASNACAAAPADMTLSVAGRPLTPRPETAGISFAAGQAGLSTLRLVCGYSTPVEALTAPAQVEFRDASYPSRAGWRELVVVGAGGVISGPADITASASTSSRLLSYPDDTGAALPQQTAVGFSFTASSSVPAPAMPLIEDAVPLGSAPADVVFETASPAALPGGSSDLPAQIGELIQASDLSPLALLIAVAVAAAVGAFHAATPGHGKTLMAAYLVGSRGTVRDALGLGLTVTVAHTVGVLALGAVVLIAGAALPSERLLPVLGVGSGLIVTVLGASMLLQRVRARRHDHEHDHAHDHAHAHADDHHHGDAPAAAPDGWHSHGARGHTHLPQSDGPLRRRNLVALGLVGGLVPSASAILILVGSIAAGRPALGMLLTVAFGLGMATVLVGVGVLLVKARSLVERVPSPRLGRAVAYAPLASAVVFLVVGAAVTLQSGLQLQ
jgi:ABC-type nickel/cobalt efflux system permease component RcnA